MKFNIIIILFFTLSCSQNFTKLESRNSYNSTGFVYIYNENDYRNKIIKKKLNNELFQISHKDLKIGTLIKLINPKTKDSIILKNLKKIEYPDYYKILITEPVAKKLNINFELPIIEVLEIKKNKSFVAKKAKIFTEEKKIPSKAPVASVQISNISKNKFKKNKKLSDDIFINIATFYSSKTAKFLRERILKEVPLIDSKKVKIKKINSKETKVILGPYNSVNLLKNDYIRLKNYGFEELDIYIDE